MAYTPTGPYPKGRGDAIRSADWNEAVNEVIRLETDKFNRAGGTVAGNLAVTGTVSGTLANNIVGTNQLAANAVTTAKIADLNVTTNKIADLNVTANKIADGNVTTAKLATASVATDKLANGSVTFDKLAGAAIGTAKMEGFLTYSGLFTIAGSGTATLGLSGEYWDSNPRYYHVLVFAHPTTAGGYISWAPRYFSYDAGGGRMYSYALVTFTNIYTTATEVQAKIWVLPGPA